MTTKKSFLKLLDVAQRTMNPGSREGIGGRRRDMTYGPYARFRLRSDPRSSGEIARATGKRSDGKTYKVTKKLIDQLREPGSTIGMGELMFRDLAPAFDTDPDEFVRLAQEARKQLAAEIVPLNKLPNAAVILAAAKELAPSVCADCWAHLSTTQFPVPTPEAVAHVARSYHATQHANETRPKPIKGKR